MLEVTLVPVLNDNYAYILQSGNDVAVLDPGEAVPIINKLKELNLTPSIIFNTHHHGDHVHGNDELKQKYKCKIIGPDKEAAKIKLIDQGVTAEDKISFGDEEITIFDTPGHTAGHICFYFPSSKILFSGDTLFSMGCGRIFEGTAEQLFDAFKIFKQLPDETKVYCGHEYTFSNGTFCMSIEPENQDLYDRMQEVNTLRSDNQPTIPSTIELEKKTNIFMRAETAVEFKKYRDLKDNF